MIEIAVRDYLRSQPELMALLNDEESRLNLEWKGDLRATHVTLHLVGGERHYYLPVGSPALMVHCFGSTRLSAAQVTEAVEQALWTLDSRAAPLQCAEVVGTQFLPTPDGVSRYVVTTSVVTKVGLAA